MVNGLAIRLRKLKGNLHLKRTFRLIWSITKGWAGLTLFMIVVESALFLASLYIFRLLVDVMARPSGTEEKSTLIVQYLIEAAVLTVMYVVTRSINTLITDIQASKISQHIDDKIHTCATNLDLSFYESPAYFDTLKRAKDAGPDRPNAIFTNIVDITKNGMMLLVLGSILISISWWLFPLLAIFILPTLLVRVNFAEKLYQWRMQQTPLERKSTYISSLITGDTVVKEIKAFGLGSYLRQWYAGMRGQLVADRLKITRKTTIQEILTTVLATLCLLTCIGFICISTIRGTTSVGDVTLFLIIFPQLFNVMNSLSAGISTLYQNNIFVSNLYELLDLKPALSEATNPIPIPRGKNVELSIHGLSFSYPHARETALKNISLNIPPGKIVTVVGLNGAGKTTLIKLLARLYDPSEGSISMGGIDVRQLKSDEYRKEVSVVFQDFGRYNVSARENIRFGNVEEEQDEEKIRRAAIQSGADGFIKKFPEGYDTIMGRVFEEGREVSIGQWQKLAIARAFYGNARFIILDEATSALDVRAEQELIESIRENIGDKGVLIISHRLSAVKHADFIYVMSEGKITQHGTHDELLSVPGEYARLFAKKTILI